MSKVLDNIIEKYPDEEFLIADGFDDAIIGVELNTMRLVYSVRKCIELLFEGESMNLEEALEYFHYNVSGSYVGEKTPIWVDDDLNTPF